MELRHLRSYVAVAEAGSFTLAASRLRVAQPALSRQLQALEDELGVRLLRRQPRGVALTPAGQLLLERARVLLGEFEACIQRVRALGSTASGVVHVGYAPSLTVELLPAALAAYRRSAPEVTVTLHDLGGNELADRLRGGALDLAVVPRPRETNARGLDFEPLRTYAIQLAMPAQHRLARRKSVPLARLGEERLVVFRRDEYADYHAMLEGLLAAAPRRPEIAAECDGANSLLLEVAAGRGVALISQAAESMVAGRLVLRSLDPSVRHEVGIARAAGLPLSPAAALLCEQLRAVA
ncbi:MAG: LysR family transcriptional regulator [Verrucomicrobia bacterium]|nr:LysR family transcriptional regulator [Verrucomicrobiota bacterium]